MKKILIILSILLLTGCGIKKDDKYFQKFAETYMGLYQDSTYNQSLFDKNEQNLLDKRIYDLNNNNQELNLSDLIYYLDSYKTNAPNSREVYLKDGICFIKTSDINLEVSDVNFNFEDSAVYVCNGYNVTVTTSDLPQSYDDLKKDPIRKYRYFGSKKENNVYTFAFRSYYQHSHNILLKLTVEKKEIKNIIIEENTNIDEFMVSQEKMSENGKYAWVAIIGAIFIIGSYFLIKFIRGVALSIR